MDNKYSTDSKAVSRAVVVLCVSLLLVYIVLYFAKGDLWKQEFGVCDEKLSTGVELSQLDSGVDVSNTGNVGGNFSMFGDYSVDDSGNSFESNTLPTDSGGIVIEDIGGMKILSGTRTYYGTLDFIEKLGVSYKYSLVDDKGIYYVNMGDYKYDFSDIVRKLGGNLYIMNTEQEILQNEMFGDKVVYINIPEYKNTKVLILLDINDQSWLLAIDYSIYHQVKSYLKSLFITTN